MKPQITKKSIMLAAICLVLGCGSGQDSSGVYKVVIPVDDGNNHYTLQTRELHTVTDLNAMAGTAAIFKATGRFEIVQDDNGHEFISGSPNLGSTPSAHFIKLGDVYHPSDFMTLSMATAMYHFENIKAFYDEFGATANLTFPRPVLINVTISRDHDGQVSQTINNASYVRELDMFWINPYKDDNVPLTINGAVLAHEYLHNVFMKMLSDSSLSQYKANAITEDQFKSLSTYAKTTSQLNEWISTNIADSSSDRNKKRSAAGWELPDPTVPSDIIMSQDDVKAVNTFLFAGINEGIADFYGYEYSHNPQWIIASLPREKLRVLSTDKVFSDSVVMQKQRFLGAVKSHSSQDRLDVHDVGAYFSHFMWLVSQDPNRGDEDVKRAGLEFMKSYAELFVTQRDRRYISMGELVRLFFKDRAPGTSLCSDVERLFPGELNDQNFKCGAAGGIVPAGAQPSPSPSPTALTGLPGSPFSARPSPSPGSDTGIRRNPRR